MTNVVLDYSNWRPSSPQALKAAGVVGVLAYIKPLRFGWPKAIKPGELAALVGAGIAVAANYENNPGDWRGGYQAGLQNGAEAAEAMAELGLPLDVPVYVSYDEEISPSQFGQARDYLSGFKKTCHREVGIYGEGALIEAMGVRFGWLSESTSFPGSSSPTPHTVVWQHYGEQVPGLPGAYDVNTIHQSDWGQYPRPNSTPAPAPKPVVVPVQSGGSTHDMANVKFKTISTTPEGLGQFVGIFDVGEQVLGCQATVLGPDPHVADASSPDDFWPGTIGATARANVHGNHVVVTVSAPAWKPGQANPAVHVTAYVA